MSDRSRRRLPRVPLEIAARFTPIADGASGREVEASIANVGPDGCFLVTSKKVQPGERLRVRFNVDSFPTTFQIEVETRWLKDGIGGGVGVLFLDHSPYERAALEDYCQRRLDEQKAARG